jgi:hypothetical protein
VKKLKPPPKGTRCDAYVGWHTDYANAPVVGRCKNLATVTERGSDHKMSWVDEVWLCAEHAGKLK